MQDGEPNPPAAPPNSHAEVLAAINSLKDSLESRVEKECKRQRLTEVPAFKRLGNEQQFRHTEKVLTHIQSAQSNLETLDVDEAKTNLQDAINEIKERQKLIKLADRSELGWGVVKEYVTDNLASDPEDVRKIKKAEKAAAAKKPATKKRGSNAAYSRTGTFAPYIRPATSSFASTARQSPFFVPTEASTTPGPVSSAGYKATSDRPAPPFDPFSGSSQDHQAQPQNTRDWEYQQGDVKPPEGVQGAWKCLTSSLQDPTLKHLASVNLPALLMSAKATSTTKKYLASWKKWEAWASSNPEVSTFPVSPFHFSLYISHLAATGPKSIAVSAAAAVSWAHGLAGIPSPTSNSMVKTALQGFKRLRSTPTVRKEPITSDTLVKLFSSHGHSNANLADLRVLFTCFVSYAGFLRFDDLSLITRRDCTVSTDRMTIHLAKSKSDQYRDGADVVIARTSKPTCPVVVAERYFKALGDPPDSPLPVLRRLVSTRSGLIPSSSSLSYTRTREIVLDALRPLVPDIMLYGLHSLRSGGASAACNAHVPSFLISKHGRWKTEKARNAYLKLDSSTTLLASKSLGI
ncbi:uncharacterized protein [Amphiura filiformis]|uniref:uncharacterized protein n=1 Tax=Amphiura filiformis TaxID=82378 RepID=UPI003B20B6C8